MGPPISIRGHFVALVPAPSPQLSAVAGSEPFHCLSWVTKVIISRGRVGTLAQGCLGLRRIPSKYQPVAVQLKVSRAQLLGGDFHIWEHAQKAARQKYFGWFPDAKASQNSTFRRRNKDSDQGFLFVYSNRLAAKTLGNNSKHSSREPLGNLLLRWLTKEG